MPTRAVTAAPGDQPASVSAVAKLPDVPKVDAATSDRTTPVPPSLAVCWFIALTCLALIVSMLCKK